MRAAWIAALSMTAMAYSAGVSHAQIVISEVYGGGGNAGAPFNQDFVEIYNNGTTAQSLAGWTVQYTSSGGNFSVPNSVALSGTLGAGQTALVKFASGVNGVALPNADLNFSSTTALSASSGKVALANNNSLVNTATPGTVTPGTGVYTNVVDFVGYGSSANQFEGTSFTPNPGNTTSVMRKPGSISGTVQDTNNNANDFLAGTPTPGVAAVPEPGSLILVGATGLVALGWRRWRGAATG